MFPSLWFYTSEIKIILDSEWDTGVHNAQYARVSLHVYCTLCAVAPTERGEDELEIAQALNKRAGNAGVSVSDISTAVF